MFTFLAFGRPAGRYVNSFNILAASAITLLLIDPMMIRQVGFQLFFSCSLGHYQLPSLCWQDFGIHKAGYYNISGHC